MTAAALHRQSPRLSLVIMRTPSQLGGAASLLACSEWVGGGSASSRAPNAVYHRDGGSALSLKALAGRRQSHVAPVRQQQWFPFTWLGFWQPEVRGYGVLLNHSFSQLIADSRDNMDHDRHSRLLHTAGTWFHCAHGFTVKRQCGSISD